MPELIPLLLAAQTPPELVRCLEASIATAALTLAGPRLTTASALLRAAASEPATVAVIAATLPGLDGPLVASLRQLGLGVVVVTWGAMPALGATSVAAGAVVVAGEALRQAPADLAAAVRASLAVEAEPPLPAVAPVATPVSDLIATPSALGLGSRRSW